jgi:hypothetical protein
MENNYIDGGYLGYDGPVNPQVPPPPPPQAPLNGDAAQELTDLATIFDAALAQYRRDGNATGMGWYGNITGLGPKCNEIFQGVSNYINMQMAPDSIYGYHNQIFDNYTFATITAGGILSSTGLTDHVYFGIVNINTGHLEYFMDPWRNVMYDGLNPAAGDPNWNVDSIEPWTFVPPAPYQGGTQDPIQGSPPGDDGHWLIH